MAKTAVNRVEDAATPPGVSDETLRGLAGYSIKRASNVVQADLARTLQPFGLRMITFTALILIVDNPDLSQTQLAGALAVERSNLVVIVDDLEKAGLIIRNPSATDRRSHALRATPDGEDLCVKAMAAARAHEKKLLSGLDPDRLAALIEAMRTIEFATAGDEQ
ncbi:MAG: MarR family winged helix-turn-helix transcriptional regulator [Oricola sp.]